MPDNSETVTSITDEEETTLSVTTGDAPSGDETSVTSEEAETTISEDDSPVGNEIQKGILL